MKKRSYRFLGVLLSLACLASCSSVRPKPVEINSSNDFQARVLSAGTLRQGGTFFVEPFKAGPGVAADESFDRYVLIMIKAIYDTIGSSAAGSRLSMSASQETADFIVKGYVRQLEAPQGWINQMQHMKNTFAVSGKMTDAKTQKVILDFEDKISSEMGEDFDALPRAMGGDIGKFIADNSK